MKAKVKANTYAGELLTNLYDEIFHRSLEMKGDYEKYYAIEYGTFADYVCKRFLFDRNIASKVSEQYTQSCKIIYFKPSYYFLEEEYGVQFLERLLEN